MEFVVTCTTHTPETREEAIDMQFRRRRALRTLVELARAQLHEEAESDRATSDASIIPADRSPVRTSSHEKAPSHPV